MSTNPEQQSPAQFSIIRLFWMTIVVALFLAVTKRLGILAELLAVFEYAGRHLQKADLSQRIAVGSMIGFMLIMTIAYLGWISFRLPYAWHNFGYIRKKRKRYRAELEREFLDHDEKKDDRP